MDPGTCADCAAATYRDGRSGPHPKRCTHCAPIHRRAYSRERSAAYRAARPELAERARETYAAWYAANRDASRAQALDWYWSNRDQARATNARWYANNVDKSRAKARARRAARNGADAEKFLAVEIYDRDDWQCWLCDEPVPRDAAWPDPLSPSLDHVTPISLDGPHTRSNVRLAHLLCNTRRGAATA